MSGLGVEPFDSAPESRSTISDIRARRSAAHDKVRDLPRVEQALRVRAWTMIFKRHAIQLAGASLSSGTRRGEVTTFRDVCRDRPDMHDPNRRKRGWTDSARGIFAPLPCQRCAPRASSSHAATVYFAMAGTARAGTVIRAPRHASTRINREAMNSHAPEGKSPTRRLPV